MTEITDSADVADTADAAEAEAEMMARAGGGQPLFPGILGGDFARLDAFIRRIHGGGSSKWRGRVSVERGTSWMARVMGLFASLPAASTDTPIEVDIGAAPRGERWIRVFGDRSRMTSTLGVRDGLLVEQLGLVSVYFRLVFRDAGIDWVLERLIAAGLPLPGHLFRISARIEVREGRYHFRVEAALRGGVLLVRYEGWLDAIT
jgi:hypothetical protein